MRTASSLLRSSRLLSALALAAALAGVGCEQPRGQELQPAAGGGSDGSVPALMKARGLSEADVSAALKTYTPTGVHDPYYMFASGGHSGHVIVIGLPSMRILKMIAVFTPEPWQGYGFGDQTDRLIASTDVDGHPLRWADVHHPALSETAGDYDGKFLFVNDKANARVAVIDLEDFTTQQIVRSGLIQSDHGATFVTPNTEYVIESSQYAAPLGGAYAPIEKYDEAYRGAVIFWKFDREKGKLVREQSFAIELPPYDQDLADAGKLASDGYVFVNSFNTERSWGGDLEGKPPMESGASQNDMDYLHVIDWKAAEKVAAAPGKTKTIAGMRVIPLATAIEEDLIHLIGEPKSPHGVDVTPDGKEIVVSGKLDTHTTVYSIDKIKALIAAKKYDGRDPYGLAILPFQEAIRGQVEVGLGPLHTQYDDKGNAYTSLFLESAVAKWSLADMKLIQKIPVHYNVGHIAAAEGDTVSPDGHFLVAMNKWAIDRFADVGPLLPQNFQLIDIGGDSMQLLYDLPIPLGEPHYAQIVKADKLKPISVYSPVGIDPLTHEKAADAVEAGQERIERRNDGVHVYMTAVRSHFVPDVIRVKQGETVHIHLTNTEQAKDATHGFAIGAYNVNVSIEPGEHSDMTFVADQAGVFPLYCTEFCSALHLEMAGYLLVEPK
jgi:nitrous-oxide reductase